MEQTIKKKKNPQKIKDSTKKIFPAHTHDLGPN